LTVRISRRRRSSSTSGTGRLHRVETVGRWAKGQTVAKSERYGGMRHFGGTATEQVDFRHNVALKLDWDRFADLIVDAVQRLTAAKA